MGHDTEMLVTLRKSVVDALAPVIARRISVSGTDVVKQVEKAIEEERKDALKALGLINARGQTMLRLPTATRAGIVEDTESAVRQTIRDTVDATINRLMSEDLIVSRIERLVEAHITTLVTEKARQRLDNILSKL